MTSYAGSDDSLNTNVLKDYSRYHDNAVVKVEPKLSDLPDMATTFAVALHTAILKEQEKGRNSEEEERLRRAKLLMSIRQLKLECSFKKLDIRKMMNKNLPKEEVDKAVIDLKVIQTKLHDLNTKYNESPTEVENLKTLACDILDMPVESEARVKLVALLHSTVSA